MIQPEDQAGAPVQDRPLAEAGQSAGGTEIEIPFPGGGAIRPKPAYRPCRDIIQLDWEPKTEIGGILIPEKAQQGMKLSFYSIPVLAAGPDCKVVKAGDSVLLPSEAILRVQYDGRVVYFCNEMKVLAVIEDPAKTEA